MTIQKYLLRGLLLFIKDPAVIQLIRSLLDYFDVDYVDEETGDSFVSAVVASGDLELVREVVRKRKASLKAINAKNKQGFTALDRAFLLPKENQDRQSIIWLLLEAGGSAGCGALNFFIIVGDFLGVKEVLNYSDVCDRDINGKTPLILAVEHGRKEIIEYLTDELKLYFVSDKEKKKAELNEAIDIASTLRLKEIEDYLSRLLLQMK